MRKLAPMILISSIAFAGAAFATDLDKNGQPTVSPNTPGIQGNSYSDKSATSPGTNAPMTEADKAKADADHDRMKARKKAMKTAKHTDKMMRKADGTAMGTMNSVPAPAAAEATAPGTAPAIRDNSTAGKNGG